MNASMSEAAVPLNLDKVAALSLREGGIHQTAEEQRAWHTPLRHQHWRVASQCRGRHHAGVGGGHGGVWGWHGGRGVLLDMGGWVLHLRGGGPCVLHWILHADAGITKKMIVEAGQAMRGSLLAEGQALGEWQTDNPGVIGAEDRHTCTVTRILAP